jgi:rhodanese-related sulfurtransferase
MKEADIMTTAITLELPPAAYEQLRRTASRQNRPVAEVVKEIVLREIPDLPSLPTDVEAELATFSHLSNDVLWLIARSALTRQQQDELAQLNDQAQRRPLSGDEQSQQQELVSVYDRVLVRRAQAALFLKQRGYDLSNPTVLKPL